MTGQKAVPVLVIDGEAIADSTRIIEALERRDPTRRSIPPTRPRAAARSSSRSSSTRSSAPHIRRAFFHQLLARGGSPRHLRRRRGRGDAALYRAVFPPSRMVMRVDMGIDAAGAERSRAKVDAAFDRLEARSSPRAISSATASPSPT